jgi:multiple inositol-polyphosphate phosphatase / 2,3-bisphosphoglycerate 3-phosphatase
LQFKYTLTQRAQKSAEAFAEGLFQNKTSTDSVWYPEALHKDPVLRFYKACDRWKRDVDKNPSAYHEVELFSESDEMAAVVDELETRTGLSELTPQMVHLIYTTCAFETLDHQMSPWCALFSKNSIRVVEFLEDLEYYWIDGYGFQLTYQQACAIGSDLLRRLEAEDPDITFYFTHSGTLLKTLAFLGLYKDDAPLTHKDHSFHKRQWRAGKIDAFATNLVFVRFE